MALTLLDVARNKKDEFEGTVVETFADHCDILGKLPLVTLNTVEVHTKRKNSASTLGFRKRGEAYGNVQRGGHDIVSDATYAMGGNIDIDYTDFHDKNASPNPLTEALQDGIEAAAWTFNQAFIRGDHASDEDEFEGIKVRLATLGADQLIYADSASDDLEVATAIAANTTADMQTWFDKIEEAIYAVDGHKPDVALTTANFIRSIKKAERRLGINKDTNPKEPSSNLRARESSNEKYRNSVYNAFGVDWYDMGVMSDNTTQVIATETIGSQATTPVYFVKLGRKYLSGIQQYSMRVTKPTLQPDNVTYRVTIDWPAGLRHVHPRFASKLAGSTV